MVWYDKVVWQEGMFLRAQHFQQQDRHTAHQLQARAAPLQAHPWGLTELTLDRDLLAAGRFAISSAAGVLEDGTPFSISGGADAPLALDLPEGTRNALVYLALPLKQDGGLEVTSAEGGPDATRARYSVRSFDAFDTHSDSTSTADLGIGRLRTRYMLQTEERAGYSCLGLARIVEVQADRKVQLDDRFIPPSLKVSAAVVLNNLLLELTGLLGQRAEGLAARLGQPGARGAAEVQDLLMLQAVNRWHPLIGHWATSGNLHPESLFAALVAMAGELATFTTPSKLAMVYPAYRHDDLSRSFAPVVADLRRSFSTLIQTNAIAIPLLPPDQNNIRRGPIEDRSLLNARQFVMAVKADVSSELLRQHFPAYAMVGAVERIVNLINAKVGSIDLRPLPAAPPQIRFQAGTVYFELNKEGENWKQMLSSGGFGVHVSHEPPNLNLELWAIRE